MYSSFRRSKAFEPVAYLLFQCLAYVIDFGSFLVAHGFFGLSPVTANVTGKIAAGAVAFVAHRYVTFSNKLREPVWRQLGKYIAVLILTTFFSSGFFLGLRHVVSDIRLAKLGADLLTIIASFAVAKTFIFRFHQA